jgi:TetR/AcrR family transcriptional regulator, ethionamide resistance regulator
MTSAKRRVQVRQSRQESRARIVAATAELVRRRSYAELSVEEIMAEAGLGRTLFYRHFDDLADLLQRAGREAIEELLDAEIALGRTRADLGPDAVREAMASAVAAYHRHGPLLRAIREAAASDEQIAAGYVAMRERFDAVAEQALRATADQRPHAPADVAETARALNLLNESYLLDAFGREPRVSVATAEQTLTEIWTAILDRGRD